MPGAQDSLLDPGWKPVRIKKTRQIRNLEPRFDSIETEKAPGGVIGHALKFTRMPIRRRQRRFLHCRFALTWLTTADKTRALNDRR